MNYSNKQIDNLHKALYNTYEDNMNFLKVVNIDLFNKVRDLSEKIENKSYQTNFEIELKNNSFDIYDKVNNNFLYNKTLEKYSNDIIHDVNFTTNGTFNDLITSLYNVKNPNTHRLFNDDINTYSTFKIQYDVYQFRKIFSYFKVENKKKLNHIPAFIFFGTLLGKHLVDIHNKIKAKTYLVIEPNLEIFRLSLFITDYKLLALNSNIFFCIGHNDIEIIESYENFIDINYLDSYMFKYYSTSLHDIKILHQFTLALKNKSSLSYDHYRQLHYIENTMKNVNKYKLLNNNNNLSTLSNKPVLILSPGPSLRKNKEWIIKNKKKFILVAFGATIKALCDFNIKPDIIISVDASTLILNQFCIKCKNIYKNSLVVLSTDSHPKLFKLFKKKNIFLFEVNFKLSCNGIDESAAISVGDNTLHILLSLGFKDIYMLGTDLCFDIETGTGYDKTHKQSKVKNNIEEYKKNIKKITNTISLESKYISTKANFKKEDVFSDDFFLRIIKNYHTILYKHNKNKDFKIYNLSDGAFIPKTIPLNIDNININKKISNKHKILKSILTEKSSFKFSKSDQNNFRIEIDFLERLISDLIIFKNSNILDYDQFYNFTREFSNKILLYKSFSQLLLTLTFGYMKTINNYINYYFNTSDYKTKTHLIPEVKNLWCKQILNILKEYKNILKRVTYE